LIQSEECCNIDLRGTPAPSVEAVVRASGPATISQPSPVPSFAFCTLHCLCSPHNCWVVILPVRGNSTTDKLTVGIWEETAVKGKSKRSFWLLMIAAGLVSVLASGCGGGGGVAGVAPVVGGSRINDSSGDVETPPPPPNMDDQSDVDAPPPPPSM
jgi:hypothetical protein